MERHLVFPVIIPIKQNLLAQKEDSTMAMRYGKTTGQTKRRAVKTKKSRGGRAASKTAGRGATHGKGSRAARGT